jgi:hypothetical protein
MAIVAGEELKKGMQRDTCLQKRIVAEIETSIWKS